MGTHTNTSVQGSDIDLEFWWLDEDTARTRLAGLLGDGKTIAQFQPPPPTVQETDMESGEVVDRPATEIEMLRQATPSPSVYHQSIRAVRTYPASSIQYPETPRSRTRQPYNPAKALADKKSKNVLAPVGGSPQQIKTAAMKDWFQSRNVKNERRQQNESERFAKERKLVQLQIEMMESQAMKSKNIIPM